MEGDRERISRTKGRLCFRLEGAPQVLGETQIFWNGGMVYTGSSITLAEPPPSAFTEAQYEDWEDHEEEDEPEESLLTQLRQSLGSFVEVGDPCLFFLACY